MTLNIAHARKLLAAATYALDVLDLFQYPSSITTAEEACWYSEARRAHYAFKKRAPALLEAALDEVMEQRKTIAAHWACIERSSTTWNEETERVIMLEDAFERLLVLHPHLEDWMAKNHVRDRTGEAERLADQVKRLESEIARLQETVDIVADDALVGLKAENVRLREALTHYAVVTNHIHTLDCGALARAALEATE